MATSASAPDTKLEAWRSVDDAHRRYSRWATRERAGITIAGSQQPCIVSDISPVGAAIRVDGQTDLKSGSFVVVNLEDYGPTPAEIRHVEGANVGVFFLHSSSKRTQMVQWLSALQAQRTH